LNGAAITERPLAEGDKIQCGTKTVLRFTYQDQFDERFQRTMFESALRDDLTKAFNKRYFMDRLAGEVAYAVRHGTPLTLAMLDIDHFKQINDRHGHLVGDLVLSSIAQTIQDAIRIEDLFARWGGEEFVLLSRGIDLGGGRLLGERIRQKIGGQPQVHAGATISVNVSIGVATLVPGMNDAEALVVAADGALYRAKESGRNCVVTANERPSR
jgi:diguanylate cyclase (GGDEF)-like protein